MSGKNDSDLVSFKISSNGLELVHCAEVPVPMKGETVIRVAQTRFVFTFEHSEANTLEWTMDGPAGDVRFHVKAIRQARWPIILAPNDFVHVFENPNGFITIAITIPASETAIINFAVWKESVGEKA